MSHTGQQSESLMTDKFQIENCSSVNTKLDLLTFIINIMNQY